MGKLWENFPKTIQEASKSPLGIAALLILVLAVLGWSFFQGSRDEIKLLFLLSFLLIGMEIVRLSFKAPHKMPLENGLHKDPLDKMRELNVPPTSEEDTKEAVRFSECKITADLTDWYQGDSERATTKICHTTRKIRAIVKSCSGHDVVKFVCATEGVGILADQSEIAKNLPSGTKWRVREDDKEGAEAPYWTSKIDHFIDQPRHKDILKKRGKLSKSYVLTVPLEEKGQIIEYTLRYQDGYQSSKGDWLGFLFPADVDEAEIRIVFPERQRYTSFKLLYGDATSPGDYVDYEDVSEAEESEDGREIRWCFKNAKEGVAYIIDWEWEAK